MFRGSVQCSVKRLLFYSLVVANLSYNPPNSGLSFFYFPTNLNSNAFSSPSGLPLFDLETPRSVRKIATEIKEHDFDNLKETKTMAYGKAGNGRRKPRATWDNSEDYEQAWMQGFRHW